MKQKIAICCCCLFLAGLTGCPKYKDYSASSVRIAEAEVGRIDKLNDGFARLAEALVNMDTLQKNKGIASTDGFEVSVTQTGVEWMARAQIADKITDAYRAAVMFRPVKIQSPATTGAIGLEVARQAAGLAGIVGGVVAFSKAMRPAATVNNAANQGGTIGPGNGTNNPTTTTTTETTIGAE